MNVSNAWGRLGQKHLENQKTVTTSEFAYDDDQIDDRIAQQFWGIRYIDDAVARRLDTNADGDYTDLGHATYFHITDVQFSSVAMIDDTS